MADDELDRLFARAADLLATADALLICAGAGMGVESGLPTFRGDDGFWQAYPPYRRLGVRHRDIATPSGFAADPALAWGFYGHRLDLYRRAVPHAGFDVLWCWGSALPAGVAVFTSNVDGHFQRAGFATVAEVHGGIHRLQCARPCSDEVWPADELTVDVDADTMRAGAPLPACRRCGGLARPNVLMFADSNWLPGPTEDALQELASWRQERRGASLVVIEIGAGTAIPTVRHHAESAAAANGALIRINPVEPAVPDPRGVGLRTGAVAALDGIDARLVTLR